MIDEKIQLINDDEIDIRALFQVLWGGRKLLAKITGFCQAWGSPTCIAHHHPLTGWVGPVRSKLSS